MQENVIITCDGVFTKSSKIPFKYRARRIYVHSHASAQNVHCIDVQVGPDGRLSWRSDWPTPTLVNKAWTGMLWTFTDTSTYYTLQHQIAHKTISADIAKTWQDAQVEYLRVLLNHWLFIRPLVTMEICDTVKESLLSGWKGEQSWKASKKEYR